MTHDHDGAANARNMREIRWHPCTIDAPIKLQCVWCVRVLVMVMNGWGWVVKVGWWCVWLYTYSRRTPHVSTAMELYVRDEGSKQPSNSADQS